MFSEVGGEMSVKKLIFEYFPREQYGLPDKQIVFYNFQDLCCQVMSDVCFSPL